MLAEDSTSRAMEATLQNANNCCSYLQKLDGQISFLRTTYDSKRTYAGFWEKNRSLMSKAKCAVDPNTLFMAAVATGSLVVIDDLTADKSNIINCNVYSSSKCLQTHWTAEQWRNKDGCSFWLAEDTLHLVMSMGTRLQAVIGKKKNTNHDCFHLHNIIPKLYGTLKRWDYI